MTRPLANLIDFIGALWVLAGLAIRSRFNFSSPYWYWRLSTAFPAARVPGGKVGMIRFAIEYARWASRIRRLR